MNTQSNDYLGRGLHSKKWTEILTKDLLPLMDMVRDKKNDLVLQIRNNYINIYYKGGNLLKITHGPGFYFDKNYFKGRGITNNEKMTMERKKMFDIIRDEKDYRRFIIEMSHLMNDYWNWLEKEKHKSLEEKDVQHSLCVENNETSDFTIIDLEFQVSTVCDYAYKKPTVPGSRTIDEEKTSPRFDIIAVRNRDKRLCVIELKKGTKALAGKKSGVGDHADSFEGSIMRNSASFIKEMQKVVEDKKNLKLLGKGFSFDPSSVKFIYAYSYASTDPSEKNKEKGKLIGLLRKNHCDKYPVIYLEKGCYKLKE